MTAHADPRPGHDVVPDTPGDGPLDAARTAVTQTAKTMSASVEHAVDHLKPHLRGWIHAVTTPLAFAAGIVLVVIAPPVAGRVAAAVFMVTSLSLFGMSAIYHRGRWSAKVHAVLRRIDHANIFLIIAGTYTPLAVLLLPPSSATTLLALVWAGAAAGLLAHLFWMNAPRWVYVPMYIALGWAAIAYMNQFWVTGGPTVVWLIISGGIAYTLGAVIYATKFPDPSPRWFGFHEIFHALTVVGFTCHTVAIFIAAVQAH